MQKLMSLIGLTGLIKVKGQPLKIERKPHRRAVNFDPFPKTTVEPTRPLYRIGDRKPSDIYRVIDLSG